MKNLISVILFSVILFGACEKGEKKDYKAIQFPSLDNLMISANLYHVDNSAPVIVLCHQARFNKFEYAGIAPKLQKKGFNCIAIDQRSGGPISNRTNKTKNLAVKNNKSTNYIDAEQDIIAAVNYAKKKYGKSVILWGSSYSATLSLHVAAENDNVAAVVSFSPGDYLGDKKMPIAEKIKDFTKPMFVTSSKRETERVSKLFVNLKTAENQILFFPENDGYHGSRALWESQDGGEEYWKAINNFLDKYCK